MADGSKKLNAGCGSDIRIGWLNLDKVKLPGVQIVHDLSHIPLPFHAEEFDEILCKNVLEHIDYYIPVLGEFHRILKPGGRLTIEVPHFTSKDAFNDPTHMRTFGVNTFRYFVAHHLRSYCFDFHFSRISRVHISFDKRPGYFYNYALEPLVNVGSRTQDFYEGSPLRVFPATNMTVVLVK